MKQIACKACCLIHLLIADTRIGIFCALTRRTRFAKLTPESINQTLLVQRTVQ